MGGEHFAGPQRPQKPFGSSPRGRGTLLSGLPRRGENRFIPAWAGNTVAEPVPQRAPPVHPRVGGEHSNPVLYGVLLPGSSPRGRGTRPARGRRAARRRFIPAWAGNTSRTAATCAPVPVHPRVGGEHCRGSHTRRGCPGSSPRGRGTRVDQHFRKVLLRFIPAWAGNTLTGGGTRYSVAVHPRVGGEHVLVGRHVADIAGSSPRGRGTPRDCQHPEERQRFIPAWAGNTVEQIVDLRRHPVHPRVGGEHSRANC